MKAFTLDPLWPVFANSMLIGVEMALVGQRLSPAVINRMPEPARVLFVVIVANDCVVVGLFLT